ncbi:MAG: SdpI family protein [Candidatus Pacebacteria bacterium]|nr:SdpI family protein [Candidatus Paceibacterota bacterium]
MSSLVARRLAWIIFAATVIGSILVYPSLPPIIATHWAADGTVNGTMDSFTGAFLLPFIMLLTLLLCIAIPYIDPLRANIETFKKQYDTFVAILMLVFACIQTALLAWNLGGGFDTRLIVLPAVGILVFYIGMLLPQTKRNWFIGIRTPWTISSDHVWQRTHELGGTLFKALGVVIVLGIFAPSYAAWIIFLPLVIIAVGLVLYSYMLYAQEHRSRV